MPSALQSSPEISIVIASCSRAGMLQNALLSLFPEAAGFPAPVEFVVVDDGSTDGTAAVLAELQALALVPLTVLHGERKGVAAARNLGSRHARGVWIASFDDDQLAVPGWLRALHGLAVREGASAVGGALALQLPAGVDPAAVGPRVRSVLGELLGRGAAPVRCTGSLLPATNNALIRRDLFEALDGYDTRFTEGGEDTDFFSRALAAGAALWFHPGARALHIIPSARLAAANIRWTSRRIGAGRARLAQHRLPVLGPLSELAIRVAVTAFRDLPQLLQTVGRGRAEAKTRRLDVLCSLWFTAGFLRALPGLLLPRSRSSRFLRSMDFRSRNGERPT